LRKNEEQLRSVLQTAKDAIILTDAAGTITSWNRGAQAMFGFAEADMRGRPLSLLIPEHYRDAHRQGVLPFALAGESQAAGKTVELHGRRKDGSEFPVELSVSSWGENEETCYCGIMRDVTERKQAEANQQEYAERLKTLSLR